VQHVKVIEPVPIPISTIAAKEITAEQAEEVLQRLAPERLKKKPGPKTQPAIEVA
jgi:hypothetical protein